MSFEFLWESEETLHLGLLKHVAIPMAGGLGRGAPSQAPGEEGPARRRPLCRRDGLPPGETVLRPKEYGVRTCVWNAASWIQKGLSSAAKARLPYSKEAPADYR